MAHDTDDLDRLLARGRYDAAAGILRRRAAERPASTGARRRLADVLVLAGEEEEAAAILRQLAEELAADGFLAQAIALFKRLERIHPASAGQQERLALLIAADRHDEPAPKVRPPLDPDLPDGSGPVPRGVWISPLFGSLSRRETLELLAGLRLLTLEPGEIAVTEDEPGDSMFLLAAGTVRVYARDALGASSQIRILEEGEFFGEISLLTGEPRTATVVAATSCELLELDRDTVIEIGERHPPVREVVRRFCLERTASRRERLARDEIEIRI